MVDCADGYYCPGLTAAVSAAVDIEVEVAAVELMDRNRTACGNGMVE